MTVSHSTADAPVQFKPFPALKIMETKCPPVKYGRPPYWRAPITPASAGAYIPTWNWNSPQDLPEGEPVTVLDVNAPHLDAMGTVQIAHSHLRRTGRWGLDVVQPVLPGYYLVTVPHWAFGGTIVHPLGNNPRVVPGAALWICAPTLALLLELEAEGHVGRFEIVDSWTADTMTEFRAWSERLRSLRGEYLDRLEMARTTRDARFPAARVDAFREGLSAALERMQTGEKCLTRRPDWAHTIHAQHAASTWRKAWRWTDSGRPLVAMADVTEIAVFSVDVPTVMARPTPPFQFDPTGREPGALKPKMVTFVGVQPEQRTESTIIMDEDDAL